MSGGEAEGEDEVIPLRAEEIAVEIRKVERGTVRVEVLTRTREHEVDEQLTHERCEIERVPIGRQVDRAPPVREEGDVTIIPVVEEIVVVERRLILKEEVRIRRVRTTETHRESFILREQEAVVERRATGVPAPGHHRDPSSDKPNT